MKAFFVLIPFILISFATVAADKAEEVYDSSAISFNHQVGINGQGFVNLFRSFETKPSKGIIGFYYQPTWHTSKVDFGLTLGGSYQRDQFKVSLFESSAKTVEYGFFVERNFSINNHHTISTMIGYNRFNIWLFTVNNGDELQWQRHGYKCLFRLAYTSQTNARLKVSPMILTEYRLTEGSYNFGDRENAFIMFGVVLRYDHKIEVQ